MVPGAILAAGRSTRMGRPKALLTCGPGPTRSFVEHIIASMRAGGVEDVLVVGRPDDVELVHALIASPAPARFIPNVNHERGQLTSIIAAVNAIDRPGVRGLMVMPVDMPLVRPETYAALLRAAAIHTASIVRAVCGGAHGHPVLFDRASFDALRRADLTAGAGAVLRASAARVVNLEVGDPGVLRDVDSVDDYVSIFGRMPDEPGAVQS
jgi:molybdenum cofactor cytidylyltransferase